jgi:hypothetical protein
MKHNFDIHKRAYVKICNNSNFNLKDIKIKGSGFIKDVGNLENQSSTVIWYYPKYLDEGFYHYYPLIDTVKLIVKKGPYTFSITFPRIEKEDCKTLYINEKLELLDKMEKKK